MTKLKKQKKSTVLETDLSEKLKRFRYPLWSIKLAIGFHKDGLSTRKIVPLMKKAGIDVSRTTLCEWIVKFKGVWKE